jgi:hypothetical protein
MPYTLSVPKSFNVQRFVAVNITRLRIVEFRLAVEPQLRSVITAELQSGSGPYVAEEQVEFDFNTDSTTRILTANPVGTIRVSAALETAVFDELARLGTIPNGTVS